MSWDDALADAADAFFDAFAEDEPVVLRPQGDRPRSVRAIVEWSPPEKLLAHYNVKVNSTIVRVRNDAFAGIDPGAIDARTWEIDLPTRKGLPPTRRQITKVLAVDGGEVVLLVA